MKKLSFLLPTLSAVKIQAEVGSTVKIGNDDQIPAPQTFSKWIFTPDCNEQQCDPQNANSEDIFKIQGITSPFIYQTRLIDRSRIRPQAGSSDFQLENLQLSDAGSYVLEVEPAQNDKFTAGPYTLEVFKRPDQLRVDYSNEYDNQNFIVANGESKEVAICKAENAKPKAKLQWFMGSRLIISSDNAREYSNDDKTFNSELPLSLSFLPSHHNVTFKCIVNQPGTPDMDPQDQEIATTVNVHFRPQDIDLYLKPAQGYDNEDEARENGMVVCEAASNPLASYNLTLPSGLRSPTRGSTSPRKDYQIRYQNGHTGEYRCSACNDYGCVSITKSVDELMDRKRLGQAIIILGLPLWAIIGICLLLIILTGAALVFCQQCRDKRAYPKKKKYGQGQLCKDDISKPFGMDGTEQQYNSVNSRTNLVPTQNNISAKSDVTNREQLKQHLQLLNESKHKIKNSGDFLKDSNEELLRQRQVARSENNINHDYFEEEPNTEEYLPQPTQRQNLRKDLDRHTSNASNRPYSEHFGYGSSIPNQGSVMTQNTLPARNSNINSSNNYGSNYGYGTAAANQETYAETTLI